MPKIVPNIADHLNHRVNHTLVHDQSCVLQKNIDVVTVVEGQVLENINRVQLLLNMTQFHKDHVKHGHLNSLVLDQKRRRFVDLSSRRNSLNLPSMPPNAPTDKLQLGHGRSVSELDAEYNTLYDV